MGYERCLILQADEASAEGKTIICLNPWKFAEEMDRAVLE